VPSGRGGRELLTPEGSLKLPSWPVSIAGITTEHDDATARPWARPALVADGPPTGPLEVELPLFSGPFRLLATLILEQKVDVCDIPVATVTEAFLRRGLDDSAGWSLEDATWFIATCASLLELKMGRILRRPSLDLEEDLIGGIAPDLHYARSLELAAFRRVSGMLAERMDAAGAMVPRTAGPPSEYAHLYPDVMNHVTPARLQEVASSLLGTPAIVDLSHVAPIRVSLSEALETVKERLSVQPNARFRDLLSDCKDRIEVVIRFLALLELYREGKVDMVQAVMFGDIRVRWHGGGARFLEPPYERDMDG
jgi:segregation and condensation protein A